VYNQKVRMCACVYDSLCVPVDVNDKKPLAFFYIPCF
jgi:hypothetical protein